MTVDLSGWVPLSVREGHRPLPPPLRQTVRRGFYGWLARNATYGDQVAALGPLIADSVAIWRAFVDAVGLVVQRLAEAFREVADSGLWKALAEGVERT